MSQFPVHMKIVQYILKMSYFRGVRMTLNSNIGLYILQVGEIIGPN
jgi:hypothetical protein